MGQVQRAIRRWRSKRPASARLSVIIASGTMAAEYQRCECWTADERLWNTVKQQFSWVRWIGERTPQ